MDVASVPQNHLGRMPEELLLEVIKQSCLSVCDLISLARTNRRHYRVTISPAYEAHVERNYGLAVYWAIQNGQHSTLDRLIENGFDVNMMKESDGSEVYMRKKSDATQLSTHHLENAVDELKRTKAFMGNMAIDTLESVTPLAWAASLGQDSTVKYLLDNGADIELQSQALCDCFHKLLQCPCFETFPHPPVGPFFFDGETWEGPWTPLHYAICKLHASTARLLLERGANANDLGGGVPALHVATYSGLEDIVDYLMANGLADINAKDDYDITALHLAHVVGRYDLVAKYLDRGADINASFTGLSGPWTIFSMACAEGSLDKALQYLRRGASPHFVLRDECWETYWWTVYTPMRLIWHHANAGQNPQSDDIAIALELEQEIMAMGFPDSEID